MKILRDFTIWANSNKLLQKLGGLDRYIHSRMLQLETLEGRITPATYTVVNNFDAGTGSLRDAITLANNTAGDDQIIFNLTGTSPYTITLGSALPTIVSTSTVIVTGGTAGALTITGPGASSLIISGSDPTNPNNTSRNFRIFTIASGGNLSISGVTVSGANLTIGNGAAFNNAGVLSVSNSTLSSNSATDDGGGIFNGASGTLTVSNSTLSSNSAHHGAGIYNSGTATVTNSTLNNNTATNDGGGINNNSGSTLNLSNSTLSGNTASTGGGIVNFATLTVTNSTISGNTAGIFNFTTLNIANTIIANSTIGGDYAGSGGSTVNATSPSTAANNLVSQGSFSWATTKTSVEINLGPLQNNGGPSFTMALGTGSVAIGAGNATISNAQPINGLDQRGFSRITSDIGAYSSHVIAVTNTSDAGTGSLRQAITNANLNAGPDIINFNITGGTGAIQTITLATALPLIMDQVTIDGTTQSGYSANTLSVGAGNNAAIKIQLDGSNFTAASGIVGLYFNTPGSSVSGLSFVNFPFAIYANNNNITIKGNYFGVNADGSAQSNGLSGVGVDVATVNAAIVGGNTVADQNIFGNLTTGIVQIAGSGSSFTGNRIGLGTTNTSFMPNTTGIQINNNANVDALNHSISANLIGKNTTGIKLIGFQGGTGTVTGTQIVGNLIGTDSTGSTNNLGNSGDAISIDDGVINTTIGNSVKPNTIAYSNQNGVFINGAASVGNTIQNNNIRNNLGRGIFLLNGANSNIASPVLTQQIPNGAGGFTYSGFVNGAANTQYTVDFYSSLISDSRSQGANYLGSNTLTTDANGNIGFTGFAPTQNQTAQGAAYVVTATATNVGFGTSVFSAGPPAQISVVSGSSQTALVGTAFANPLTAKVVDSRGDSVPNIQVQFAAPNSNPPTNPATGTFPVNQQTIIAITNTVGEAVSTTLTANNAPGNFTVLAQVVNNAGIAPVSFALTNTPSAPTITSFTPTSGPTGTSVVISGSGFVGTTVVRFNGITATNVVVNSATQITAMAPAGATTGPISLTTPGGTVTTTTNFTNTSNIVSSFKVELANPGQQIFAGVPVSVTITALNSTGGVDSNFVGFVNISTTDSSAIIPANVAFVAGDNGVVAITAIFRTLGPVTVTANFNGNATGSGSGIVLQGSNEPFQVSSPSAPVPFPLGVSITKDLAFLTGVTSATISEYVATIVWGDGSQNSAGTFTPSPNQPGVFQVLGTHTYTSLEVFTGSVTVTRISNSTSSSSSFNAVVLTPRQKDQLNGANGAILPPGGLSADARINGINTFYKQPQTNPKTVILFAGSFIDNPQSFAPTLPAQNFYDVRLINPEPGALLTLTASFSGGLQRNSSPYLQFAQDTSTSYENVVSANNLVIINYIDSTITVYLDQSSFPLINNLRGTVFAVVTNTTQVSSNTITILPAAFTSGTAVGIAWGSSSTLVDVSSSANASNTSLTFQNSRQTTLSLAPSQSKGTVILRTVNNGGTTNDEASKETIKQLINTDIIKNLIRGTIGIGPEVIGGMIKKMLPENAGDFLKEWSKVISEIKAIPNDMITPKVNAIPQTNNGLSTDNPEECDDSFLEDAAFDDISKISSAMGLEDESTSCLNGVSPDSMLEELVFCGEINWAGLALSTLTLSQFRTFSKDKSKRVRPIKVGA